LSERDYVSVLLVRKNIVDAVKVSTRGQNRRLSVWRGYRRHFKAKQEMHWGGSGESDRSSAEHVVPPENSCRLPKNFTQPVIWGEVQAQRLSLIAPRIGTASVSIKLPRDNRKICRRANIQSVLRSSFNLLSSWEGGSSR
jgi:hypothetical protein